MSKDQVTEKTMIAIAIISTLILVTMFFSWRITSVVKTTISTSIQTHVHTDIIPVIRQSIEGQLPELDKKITVAIKKELKEESIGSTFHVVQQFETLSSISRMYHTTVEELIRLNPEVLSNPDLIYPGLALKLPKERS